MDVPVVPSVSIWRKPFIKGGVIGVGILVLAYVLALLLSSGFSIFPSYILVYVIPVILTEIFDAGYSSSNSSSFLISFQSVTTAGFVVAAIYYFLVGGFLGLFYRYHRRMVAGFLCLVCAGILIGAPFFYNYARYADPPRLFGCKLIANEQTRQSCLSHAQVRTGNPANCEQFSGKSRDYCFYGFALGQNDPTFCRKMDDIFIRAGCLSLVFSDIKYKDVTLQDCLSFTDETHFNSCIVGLANRDHNTELCSYLKNDGRFWKEQCQSSLQSNKILIQ